MATVKDPPQEGGVIMAIGVGRVSRPNVGILARKATKKMNVRRSKPTQVELNRVEPNQVLDKGRVASTIHDDWEVTPYL